MLSLNFSPFPALTTERLLLRCISLADAPELFLLRTDKAVMEYVDREPFKSIEETNSFIEKILEMLKENEGLLWVITLKESPQTLIGTIGFWHIVKENYRAEIGYMLKRACWQKGIMKEALKTCIEYGFEALNLHSIEANTGPANTASAAVLKSCGFIQEAHFHENYFFNGAFKDSAVFSLIKKIPTTG